jgi:hypothetical protein
MHAARYRTGILGEAVQIQRERSRFTRFEQPERHAVRPRRASPQRAEIACLRQSLKRQCPSFPLVAHAAIDGICAKRLGPGSLLHHSAEPTLRCMAVITPTMASRGAAIAALQHRPRGSTSHSTKTGQMCLAWI